MLKQSQFLCPERRESQEMSRHLHQFIDQTVNTLISDSIQHAKSRCVESCESEVLISQLKLKISTASQEIDTAERSLLLKKESLTKLKTRLESETIKLVSNLKSVESESSRDVWMKFSSHWLLKVRVRYHLNVTLERETPPSGGGDWRDWRSGPGWGWRRGTWRTPRPSSWGRQRCQLTPTQQAATLHSFQEASEMDQLDLEGKCLRRPRDKRCFRRTGVCVGRSEGRDGAWWSLFSWKPPPLCLSSPRQQLVQLSECSPYLEVIFVIFLNILLCISLTWCNKNLVFSWPWK